MLPFRKVSLKFLWIFLCFAVWISTLAGEPAHALTLTEALALARDSDPTLRSVASDFTVAQERAAQAAAARRPQLTATVTRGWNHRDYATRSEDTLFFPNTNSVDSYDSDSQQLRLTVPVWHVANWVATVQAEQVISQAQLQRVAAEQDVLVRLAQAWFDVMQAQDNLVYAQAVVAAATYDWEQAQHAGQFGLGAGPAREEAHAKYVQALAEQAATQAEQETRLAALEQIIGPQPPLRTPMLAENYPFPDPRAQNLEHWLHLTETQNPQILALQHALSAAEEEIRKQYAAHAPSLDLVATAGRTMQGVGDTPSQRAYHNRQSSFELQFTLPLYTGGGTSAKVREAVALREKASANVENARRQARATAKQAWYTWQAGQTRHTAALQGVKYTALASQAAVSGNTSGVKYRRDMLQTRVQLTGAVVDLAKARYTMILSHIKLKAAAGQLNVTDLSDLDTWLQPRNSQ